MRHLLTLCLLLSVGAALSLDARAEERASRKVQTQQLQAAAEVPVSLSGKGPYSFSVQVPINGREQTVVFEGLQPGGAWVRGTVGGRDAGVQVQLRAGESGASALAGALDRDHDGSILDNLGGFLIQGTLTDASGQRVSLTEQRRVER